MRAYSCLIYVLMPIAAAAGELSYFESKIDFWGTKNQTSGEQVLVEKVETPAGGKFPWSTYLDPKNKEFFREGDYTPPEPFMEIARSPTDENIKNWFEFMKKKNELAKRLDERVREYLVKVGQAPLLNSVPQRPEKEDAAPQVTLDAGRFKVRMYFESTCPHCKRMFGVLSRLKDEGIEVHALQIDRGPLESEMKTVSVGRATPEEIKKHGINGVPFIVIADTKRKALLPPIQGYHDFDEVVGLLKSASR